MSNVEKQLNIITRYLTAETGEARERALEDLRRMAGSSAAVVPASLPVAIDEALIELGVPCHIKGYPYLITAIAAVIEDEENINAVTTTLYPLVAKKHGTSPSRAERAIRHAVELCWDRGDLDILQKWFGYTVSNTKGKPTNSEFIARVANTIRFRLQESA